MGLLLDIVALFQQGLGWVAVLLAMSYEVMWPFWSTKLQTYFEEIDDGVVEEVQDARADLNGRMDCVEDKVDETAHMQKTHIQTTRGLARAVDGMDEDAVDDYLVENGVSPDAFLSDEEDES